MTNKHKTTSRIKSHIMQAMVEAALEGHDISDWHAVDATNRHFQAICRQCHQPALVSDAAAIVIPGRCPG